MYLLPLLLLKSCQDVWDAKIRMAGPTEGEKFDITSSHFWQGWRPQQTELSMTTYTAFEYQATQKKNLENTLAWYIID